MVDWKRMGKSELQWNFNKGPYFSAGAQPRKPHSNAFLAKQLRPLQVSHGAFQYNKMRREVTRKEWVVYLGVR